MADKTPLKLVDLGSGQGAIKEMETGDTLPASVMPTTDSIAEGATNLYFSQSRVRSAPLTGMSVSNSPVTATDTMLSAAGKFQGQINAKSELGISQTWQNLTASRAIGTTYTNSTTKPIQVYVLAGPTSGALTTVSANVGGVGGLAGTYSGVVGNYITSAQFIVPPGITYLVTIGNGTAALVTWMELR